jgi:hypothetical protein
MTLPSFLRLMFLSLLLMSACVVMFSLYIWFAVKEQIGPNLSFRAIHSQFGVIPLVPKLVLTPFEIKWVYGLLWAPPISTIVVFGFYTVNREAAKDYGPLLSWVSRRLASTLSFGYVIDIPSSTLLILRFNKDQRAAKVTNFRHLVPMRRPSPLFRIKIRQKSSFLRPRTRPTLRTVPTFLRQNPHLFMSAVGPIHPPLRRSHFNDNPYLIIFNPCECILRLRKLVYVY